MTNVSFSEKIEIRVWIFGMPSLQEIKPLAKADKTANFGSQQPLCKQDGTKPEIHLTKIARRRPGTGENFSAKAYPM